MRAHTRTNAHSAQHTHTATEFPRARVRACQDKRVGGVAAVSLTLHVESILVSTPTGYSEYINSSTGKRNLSLRIICTGGSGKSIFKCPMLVCYRRCCEGEGEVEVWDIE